MVVAAEELAGLAGSAAIIAGHRPIAAVALPLVRRGRRLAAAFGMAVAFASALVVVAEPGGDLVARALEEAALVAAAAAVVPVAVARPLEITVTGISRTLVASVEAVIGHVISSTEQGRRKTGRKSKEKTISQEAPFPDQRASADPKRQGETLAGQAIGEARFD